MTNDQRRLVVDLHRMLKIREAQYKLVLEDKSGPLNYTNIKNKGWNEALDKIGELLCDNCEEYSNPSSSTLGK